jgi:hypothetical protein
VSGEAWGAVIALVAVIFSAFAMLILIIGGIIGFVAQSMGKQIDDLRDRVNVHRNDINTDRQNAYDEFVRLREKTCKNESDTAYARGLLDGYRRHPIKGDEIG